MQNYLNIDLDLFQQPKVQKLEYYLGSKAVVFYIKLKLLLARAGNYKLIKDYPLLSEYSGLKIKVVQALIEDFDLFVIDDYYFWCEDVIEKMLEQLKDANENRA